MGKPDTEIEKYEPQTLAREELTVAELVAQVGKIQEVLRAVMQRDTHYGVIPGTPKPTLLKAGAEKLCLLFRLDPEYSATESQDGNHLTVRSTCTLYHIPTGLRRGSGMGSCSTRESKYAWRQANRKCPQCGAEAIIRGKEEYGGGWLCFAKRGGCSAKFRTSDAAIEQQQTGRVPNEDLADQYNTVLKMANKRSLVAAVLNVTAASDIFTQDVEDIAHTPPLGEQSQPHNAQPDPREPWRQSMAACQSLKELSSVWAKIPSAIRPTLATYKDELKYLLADPERAAIQTENA